MHDATEPDNTAVRVALWRALHVEIDPPPHVLTDEIGLRLIEPDPAWRQRRDMDPRGTSRNRASIVGRARFVEDLVEEQAVEGVDQYVILGAGVDTFVQRRVGGAPLEVFEIDQPGTQAWKRRRLADLGLVTPEWLHFVPVDFEAGASWRERLAAEGFDADRPAVVASTGVTMYLSRDTVAESLREAARCAPGRSSGSRGRHVPPGAVRRGLRVWGLWFRV